ncbi:hypothetical protein BG006_005916 [Podila minutissima]|uniref:Uncharacterized protein n=1 Tax=Podila minutissima TaxID=64525 RepID=A0A9P5VQP2_9FUNG|nr:hypothetical protein BG006_005916 [Podila minutissima]
MTPLPSLCALLSLALVLLSLSSALPVERRRNPLASIILGGGSSHDNGRSGVSVGLGLHRPGGLILGRRSDPEINSAGDSGGEYHTQPWTPPVHKKKRSLPEPEATDESDKTMHILPYPYSLQKRGAEAQGYRPGGPGSGGQYDKGQPYGR